MKKILKIAPLGALSFFLVGNTAAAQSEITGTLTGSGETTDTTDTDDGTLGGTVSGDNSSGTLGGTVTSDASGGTLGGTVSGGSSGGGGSSRSGGGGSSSNNNNGEVLGASDENTGGSVLGNSVGFPNTGLGGDGLTLMFAVIAAVLIAGVGIYLASRRTVR